jgi:hypothetical protein
MTVPQSVVYGSLVIVKVDHLVCSLGHNGLKCKALVGKSKAEARDSRRTETSESGIIWGSITSKRRYIAAEIIHKKLFVRGVERVMNREL